MDTTNPWVLRTNKLFMTLSGDRLETECWLPSFASLDYKQIRFKRFKLGSIGYFIIYHFCLAIVLKDIKTNPFHIQNYF